MKRQRWMLFVACGLLGLAGVAGAAETPFDVDVVLRNRFDREFKSLPVFLRVSTLLGRGIDYGRVNPEGFRVYDAQGVEMECAYRALPPAFSLADDELIVTLPAIAAGAEVRLRVTNESARSRRLHPADMAALVANANNLVPNGGFEQGAEGWEGGQVVDAGVRAGSKALLVEAPGSGGRVQAQGRQVAAFLAGRRYHFSLWAKSENVVRHSYRWEDAGGRILFPGGPLTLKFLHSFQNPNPETHFRVMDNRDWYCYRPESDRCVKDASAALRITLNQVYKPIVDGSKPARIWVDDILLFEQPEIAVSGERVARALTPGDTFLYRRAATCTGSTFGPIAPPRPTDRIAAIADTALRGERKLITLGVCSRTPLADLVLEPTDLSGPGGAKLAKDGFEIEFNYTPATNWSFKPDSLEGWCIDGNVPRSTDRPGFVDWFVGIRVPADARPGTYKGTVAVKSGTATLGTLPLTLTVADLPLVEITDRFMGEIYNNGCGPDGHMGAVLPPRDTAYYRYYSRCNFTMMMMFSHFLPFTGNGPEVDMPKLLAQMKELRDVAGCSAGVGLYWDCSLDQQGGRSEGGSGLWSRCGKNPDAYRAAVQKLDAALAEAKLPRLLYMIWDEPRFFDKRLQILKGTGALTTADIFANEMFAALEDKCFTHTSCDDPSYEPGPMLYEYCRKKGIRMGMAGWPSPSCTRYQTGMLYASSDMNYWHHWYGNQFIAWHPGHKAFVRGSNVIGLGEGMVDLRYYETLRRLMDEARRRGKAAAEVKAAEAYLKGIFDYCTGDWHWVGVFNGSAQEWGDDWFYDRWRAEMRRHALGIAKELPGGL